MDIGWVWGLNYECINTICLISSVMGTFYDMVFSDIACSCIIFPMAWCNVLDSDRQKTLSMGLERRLGDEASNESDL